MKRLISTGLSAMVLSALTVSAAHAAETRYEYQLQLISPASKTHSVPTNRTAMDFMPVAKVKQSNQPEIVPSVHPTVSTLYGDRQTVR
jgi:hypothetical protein